MVWERRKHEVIELTAVTGGEGRYHCTVSVRLYCRIYLKLLTFGLGSK